MSFEKNQKSFEAVLDAISDGPIRRDPDGDYVINYGGATFYARIVGDVISTVQIFSVVASGLPGIPDLFAYLNRVNSTLFFVRAFHFGDQVLIETDVNLGDVGPSSFHNLCRQVAIASDQIADGLIRDFQATPRWQNGKKTSYAFGFGPN
jgi:hypothetical protein